MFQHLDNWLLDSVFQRVADWFQDTYGKSYHWLAATVAYTLAGFAALEAILFRESLSSMLPFFAILVILGLESDSDARKSTQANAMNPLRISRLNKCMRYVSIFFVLVSTAMLGIDFLFGKSSLRQGVAEIESLLGISYFYLICCNNRPPKPRARKVTKGSAVRTA